MKRKSIPAFIILAVILGMLWYLPRMGSRSATGPVNAEAESPSAGQKHSGHAAEQQTEEVPEMDAPEVEITMDAQQMVGVKTAEAAVVPIQKKIRTVGRIEYDETKIVAVNTKFEGWIEKLYVDFTGKYIRKGEPLAEIYSPELLATQRELINLQKWAGKNRDIRDATIAEMLSKDADAIIGAARQRLSLWDISDSQIKKIEETGVPVKTLTVYSPVSGYVIQKTALQGMRVMPGEKLFTVADLSMLWVMADVYEHELPLVKTGAEAKISLSYLPGREFSSRVDYIYPTLSGETRTVKVRFVIPNPGGQLKPQMFTDVDMTVNLGSRLAVPSDAVIDTGTRHIVYVDKGEEYFEPREVVPGLRAEGMVEILKGLKAGERVASSATFLIDSEAQLKGIVPASGAGHSH